MPFKKVIVKHEVIFVTTDNETVSVHHRRAPAPSRMIYNRPKGSKFVMRWFPRLGVWRVYDVRRYKMNPSCGQFYHAPRPSAETPDRDAAIGYALVMP